MINFTPHDWYWTVGGDDANVYSSRRAMSVPVGDADYQAWLAGGNLQPTPVASMRDIELQMATLWPPGTLASYAQFKRWEKEQGGITPGGLPIATDDRSKQMLMGARIASDANPEFTTQWVADGNVYPLTSQQIIDISNAVLAHVSSCFATFATVSSGIDNGTITTREQIDAAFAMQG